MQPEILIASKTHNTQKDRNLTKFDVKRQHAKHAITWYLMRGITAAQFLLLAVTHKHV